MEFSNKSWRESEKKEKFNNQQTSEQKILQVKRWKRVTLQSTLTKCYYWLSGGKYPQGGKVTGSLVLSRCCSKAYILD